MDRRGVAKTEPFYGLYVAESIHPLPDFLQLSLFTKKLNITFLLLRIEKMKPLHIFKTSFRCFSLPAIKKAQKWRANYGMHFALRQAVFKTRKT